MTTKCPVGMLMLLSIFCSMHMCTYPGPNQVSSRGRVWSISLVVGLVCFPTSGRARLGMVIARVVFIPTWRRTKTRTQCVSAISVHFVAANCTLSPINSGQELGLVVLGGRSTGVVCLHRTGHTTRVAIALLTARAAPPWLPVV